MIQLRYLGKIRNSINQQAALQVAHSFITAKLDMGNVLLFGLPAKTIIPLQTILITAARIVTKSSRQEHITPVLHQLHWLPIPERIRYKVLLMLFKALHTGPAYLTQLVPSYTPGRNLRSADESLLEIHVTRKKVGERAFANAGPVLHNNLPKDLRQCPTISTFKPKLKTHLFKLAFNE